MSEIEKGSLRAWLMASRLPTLAAAIVPVAVGGAVAHVSGDSSAVGNGAGSIGGSGLRWWPTLACLWGAIWIQIGTNYANDVFDFEKGADTSDRLGPTRAVQAGLIGPSEMRRAMVLAFGLAFASGVYLVWVAGWPIALIGVVSILSGIAYTGGPYPLGYNGLGDVFVLIFFGFVAVCGTAWVNLLAVPELAWWASVPPGTLATAILVVNNVRDRQTDVLAGKRTLAVRLGRRAGLAEYASMLVLAYAVPAWLFVGGDFSAPILLPLLTLPLGIRLWRTLVREEGKALNPVLVGTARLLVLHGVLFTAGLVLGA